MSSKKEVTIGITINLENYENLRLEVEGDAETQEDVDDLITFLDGVLARLGRSDQATAERVDAYRRRVLAAPRVAIPEKEVPTPVAPVREPASPEEKACPTPEAIRAAIPPEPPRVLKPEAPAEKPEEKTPAKPEPPRVQAPPEKPLIQPEAPAVQAPPQKPEEKPPVQEPVKPSGTPAEGVCEVCGAEVTKSQAKLSQLFMSKTLCKKCMEQP